MKLNLPSLDVLPGGFSHLRYAASITSIGICTSNRSDFSLAIQPDKSSSLFGGLNDDNITNVPEFADSFQLASQNAGRRIFFRTRLFKTSVELLSMTTGLCSVRVKNKATGEATLLLMSRFN